mgnify:CR=1 FL=1
MNLDSILSTILGSDEQILYRSCTEVVRSHKILLGFGIFSILSSIFFIFLNLSTAALLFFSGIILIILYRAIRERSWYIALITNKRVMEVIIDHGRPRILKSCSIFEVQPVVKDVLTTGNSIIAEGSSTSIAQAYGSIAFIKDGKICLEFQGVLDPYGLRDTIIAIIKSSNR